VIDRGTVELLEGGSALTIGTVRSDGVPHAARAWGLDLLAHDPMRVRVLLDAHDTGTIENLQPGANVAVTATSVPTFHSVQLKGTSRGIRATGDGDAERFARYERSFYDDIETADRTPRHLMERLSPEELVAVELDITEVYDQTPGPGAGQELESGGT
jgi:hypothetical protein